jgi:hypothetical protein
VDEWGNETANDLWMKFVRLDHTEDYESIVESLKKWNECQLWELAWSFQVPVPNNADKRHLLDALARWQLIAHSIDGKKL